MIDAMNLRTPNPTMRSAPARRLLAAAGVAMATLLAHAPGHAGPVVGQGARPTGAQGSGLQNKIYGAWSLMCAGQGGPCQLSQVVARDPSGQQVVLGATVVLAAANPGGPPRPMLEFRMSPDVVQKAGIGLKIGDGPEYRLRMSKCDTRACLASGWLEGDLRKALATSPVAQVAFLMPPKQQLAVPLSLAGFEEGVQALQQTVGAAASARTDKSRAPR